jgi:glycosyltransferase involved in cell wall biosynthesis
MPEYSLSKPLSALLNEYASLIKEGISRGKAPEISDSTISHIKKTALSLSTEKQHELFLRIASLAKRVNLHYPSATTSIRFIEVECGSRYIYSESEVLEHGGKRLGIDGNQASPTPCCTIITVVRNGEEHIKRAISSVLQQTYTDFEYLVIDGGSTDGTKEIIKAHLSEIDYYISSEDGGIYNAMNKGLALARGKFICFLNCDDFYAPWFLERCTERLEETKADIIYSSFAYVNQDGYVVVQDEAKEWNDGIWIRGIPGGHETMLVTRETYNRVGGYSVENISLISDYEWICRAYSAGARGEKIEEVLLFMQEGGASFNQKKEKKENLILLRALTGITSEHALSQVYKAKYYNCWNSGLPNDLLQYLLDVSSSLYYLNPRIGAAVRNTAILSSTKIVGRKKPAIKGTKLRICIAVTYLVETPGGAERIAIESANQLSSQGHSVTIITAHGKAGWPAYRLNPDVTYIDIASNPYKDLYHTYGSEGYKQSEIHELHCGEAEIDRILTSEQHEKWLNAHSRWLFKLYRGFFKSHNFDALVSHMPSTYPYIAEAIKDLCNRPIHIACLHNPPIYKFWSKLYPSTGPFESMYRLSSLAKCDRISVLFEHHINQLPALLREKCFALTNFLAPDFMEAKDNHGGHRDKTIVAVGRHVRQKDHMTLLKSYLSIKDIFPDWTLLVYGPEGECSEELRIFCAENDLKYEQIFMPPIHSKKLREVFETCGIYVLPSIFEGFGLSLLEAQSQGAPCVAFADCDGPSHIIQDNVNGLLIDIRDKESEARAHGLSATLKRLISSPGLRMKLSTGSNTTSSKYSVARYCETLISEINESLKKNQYVCLIEAEHDKTVLADDGQEIRSAPHIFDQKTNLNKSNRYAVANVSAYTTGGAGIAARRLHQSLYRHSEQYLVNAFALGGGYPSHLPLVLLANNEQQQLLYDKEIENTLLHKNLSGNQGMTLFSLDQACVSKDEIWKLLSFDIIHLHWTNRLLNSELLFFLKKFDKPIVWTMHDMNTFTGGCHYSNGCSGYSNALKACGDCPQLGGFVPPVPPHIVLDNKNNSLPTRSIFVSPSTWLADRFKESSMGKRFDVVTIPNTIDTDIYVPMNKQHARNALGLDPYTNYVLFACQDHAERRKGADLLWQTILKLAAIESEFELITIGYPVDNARITLPKGIKANDFGFVNDETLMATIYSASSVTLYTGREDNLPNILLESVACGTPICAFNVGGVSDVVKDGQTGFLVHPFNVNAMARKACLALRRDMTQSCRKFALDNFSEMRICRMHEKVYSHLLNIDVIPDVCQSFNQAN